MQRDNSVDYNDDLLRPKKGFESEDDDFNRKRGSLITQSQQVSRNGAANLTRMDQVQMLREQNQTLKSKVTALTLALDKAMRQK